eukprot:SAG22_NODE_4432_length_1271_cov_1.285836_2_plen_233_part_00
MAGSRQGRQFLCFPPNKMQLVLAAAAAAAVLAASTARAPDGDGRPDIVFVLVDDLGHNDVGYTNRTANGTVAGRQIITPNIDKLADGGLVLTNYYVQEMCTPTRAALMTGRWAAGEWAVLRLHTQICRAARASRVAHPWARALPRVLEDGCTAQLTRSSSPWQVPLPVRHDGLHDRRRRALGHPGERDLLCRALHGGRVRHRSLRQGAQKQQQWQRAPASTPQRASSCSAAG